MSQFKLNEQGFESVEEAFKDFNPDIKDSTLDYFFNSYSYIDIHQEMLSDKVRT